MKNIAIAIAIIIVSATVATYANITVDTANGPAVVATVRDHSNPNYSIPVDAFDLESIQENSTLYIEWKSSEGVETLELEYFAWREDGQLILTHSGLDWWLEEKGILTQNHGGDRWGTWLTDEGMFFYDVENDVSWKIPFAAGTDYAVTVADTETILQEVGII